MAGNPMQKKARNSFLLGVVLTMIVFLLIGAAGYFLLIKPKQEEKEKEEEEVAIQQMEIYVLNQNVKAGQTITPDMFEKKNVNINIIPSNYVEPTDIVTMQMQTREGR